MGKFHTNLQKEEIQLQKFFGVQRKKRLVAEAFPHGHDSE